MAGQTNRILWIVNGVVCTSELGVTPAVDVTQAEREAAISANRIIVN